VKLSYLRRSSAGRWCGVRGDVHLITLISHMVQIIKQHHYQGCHDKIHQSDDNKRKKGIISAYESDKPRQILVSKQQWDEMCASEQSESSEIESSVEALPVTREVDQNQRGWEFILLSDVINEGIENSTDLRNNYNNNISLGVESLEVSAVWGWLSGKCNEVLAIMATLTQLVEVEYIEAIGEPGQPGDAEKIIKAAEGFVGVYRRLYEWAISFNSVAVDNTLQNLLSELKDISLTAIAALEKYNEDLKIPANKLKAGEPVDSISITISINPDFSRYQAEFDRVTQMYGLNT